VEYKAMALGWVATVVAPHDKLLACSLIDQALAIFSDPKMQIYTGYGGRASKAAFLAVQAKQIGYPDIESVVYRVLACRTTKKNAHSPVAVLESHVAMASMLALVDPQTAKGILQSIEPQSEAIGSGMSGVGQDDWLKAWMLVDPRRGAELFDRELAAMKGNPGDSSRLYRLAEAVEVLAVPLPEKLRYLSHSSDFRSPEEDP
jgi:hypothetical protein